MKRAKAPTASEQRWQDWLRAQGYAVCGAAAMIHHCVGTQPTNNYCKETPQR